MIAFQQMPGKLPDEKIRNHVLSVRFTAAEGEELSSAAGETRVSDWIRDTVLWVARKNVDYDISQRNQHVAAETGLKTAENGQVVDDTPTWAAEWAKMLQMDPMEANARLVELAAGRKFPSGFMGWSKQRRIDWLEENWPL